MAKKADKTISGDILTVTFISGEVLAINLAELPSSIVHQLAMHGLSQKIGDSYAGGEPADAFARATTTHTDLLAERWSSRAASSGPRTTQLAEALAAATGQPLEAATAALEAMDDDAKKDLRKHPQIKVHLASIKAAAAQAAATAAAAAAQDAPALTL